MNRLATASYKKAGDVYAQNHDYYKAIEICEWCADNSDPGPNVTHIFLAGICHIATGVSQY